MFNLCATFSLFSLSYFLYLVVAIVLSLALYFAFRNFEDKKRTILKIILVSFMGLMLILEYIGLIVETKDFNFLENLPINIHQVFVYFCIYLLVVKESTFYKFSYLIMLPLACYEIIFVPSSYFIFNEFSLVLISYILVNTAIIVYSLLLHHWSDDYVSQKDILVQTLNWVIIFCSAHLINVFLQLTGLNFISNYFGTMGAGYDLIIGAISTIINIPLLCVLPVLALLVGIEYLLMLPSKLITERRESRAQLNELIALGNLKAQQAHRDKERRRKERSQVLIRGENRAQPAQPKNQSNNTKAGFVSVNKVVQTNNDEEK